MNEVNDLLRACEILRTLDDKDGGSDSKLRETLRSLERVVRLQACEDLLQKLEVTGEARRQATSDHESLRATLLLKAAPKPIRKFLQLDGFDDMWGDNVTKPDKDGDVLFGGETYELNRSGNPVRVLVHEGTPKATVLRLLTKIGDWVERDALNLRFAPERAKSERAKSEREARAANME
jgi:hypothetical protein